MTNFKRWENLVKLFVFLGNHFPSVVLAGNLFCTLARKTLLLGQLLQLFAVAPIIGFVVCCFAIIHAVICQYGTAEEHSLHQWWVGATCTVSVYVVFSVCTQGIQDPDFQWIILCGLWKSRPWMRRRMAERHRCPMVQEYGWLDIDSESRRIHQHPQGQDHIRAERRRPEHMAAIQHR